MWWLVWLYLDFDGSIEVYKLNTEFETYDECISQIRLMEFEFYGTNERLVCLEKPLGV